MSEEYVRLFADLDEEAVLELTQKRIEAGEDPMAILEDTREGMALVGKRFAEQEYFLPELIFSGELLQACAEIIKPLLAGGPGGRSRRSTARSSSGRSPATSTTSGSTSSSSCST